MYKRQFSDGGKFNEEKSALVQTEKMLIDGAEIIDIGAQSTRPNSEFLKAEDEISRIGTVISKIKKEFPEALISLDTFYSEVVKFGFNEGIDMAVSYTHLDVYKRQVLYSDGFLAIFAFSTFKSVPIL